MIAIENTSKSYKGRQAVNGLSLYVNSGEIYGLLGPNGAGKSTTLNILLGFLKPDSGKAIVNGADTTTESVTARKWTGYIPENVNLYPFLSGVENLDYFCKIAGIKYNNAELSGILTACGLQDDAHDRKTATYSKGMRQKVGIAIAYAKKAKVYLLDEPASGLDPLAITGLFRIYPIICEKNKQQYAQLISA